MKRFLLAVPYVIWSLSSSSALAFPGFGRSLPLEPTFAGDATNYDFEGIVALSGCSGSIVRFDDSQDTDQAMILSNGHCVKMIEPNVVIQNQVVFRKFDVLSPTAAKLGTVTSTKLLFATMTKTDVSLYLLKETYQEILSKFKTQALTLAREAPVAGTQIEIISGYWKRGYSCAIEALVKTLKEGKWTFTDSLRYTRPGCEVIGGTSGSPVVAAGTRNVLGVNNTINESGKKCQVNNPCEVGEDGSISAIKGVGYAQQTFWFYSCRNESGALDLNQQACLLPKAVTKSPQLLAQ